MPKVLENNANVVQTGDQIENLKKELIDAQRELGTLYQTRFGAISQDLGFPSADSAANFCNAFAHLGVSTNQNFNDVIDDFTAMKNQLQHQRQQLQQHIAEILPSQGTRIDLMTWEKLLVHGKQIAKSVEEFSEYVNEFFYLEFQKAKIANVASAVKYVNELLRINALVKVNKIRIIFFFKITKMYQYYFSLIRIGLGFAIQNRGSTVSSWKFF